jgi:hypothetical protein
VNTRKALPWVAAVMLCVALTAYTPASIDLGWILEFGRRTLSDGALPRVNDRSFLEPGHPVVLHEWAACVLTYGLHRAGGGTALIVARILGIALLLGLVDGALRALRVGGAARLLTLLAAALTLPPAVALTRPQWASVLGTAVVAWAILDGRRRSLWLAAAIFLPWANLHGGWVAGLAVLAAGCGLLWAEGLAAASPGRLRAWEAAAVPVAAAALLLVNPYGVELLRHTFHHVSDAERNLNAEWLPVLRSTPPLRPFERSAAWLMAGVLAVGALAVRPWRAPRAWGLALLGALAGVYANRNLRLAPILMAPLLGLALDGLLARAAAGAAASGPGSLRDRLDRLAPAIAAGAAALAALGLGAAGPRLLRFSPYLGPDEAPLVDLLARSGLRARVWNDFNAGSLLLWGAPEVQVSCDGRNVAAYSPALVARCVRFGLDGDPLDEFTKDSADFALLPQDHPALPRLRDGLSEVACALGYCLLGTQAMAERLKGTGLEPRPLRAADWYQGQGSR